MPRGSKPGERRGGRQRGTPNKSTLLKNAAIKAAGSDPNLSPLDFLLKLMRQRDLPLEVRVKVAQQTLPFAHSKPKAVRSTKDTYGGSQIGVNVRPGPRVKVVRVKSDDADVDSITPLDFLLGVMRDENSPTPLRLKVTGIVAPYVHPKGEPNEVDETGVEMKVVEDPYGFDARDTEIYSSRWQRLRALEPSGIDCIRPGYPADLQKAKKTPAFLELEKRIADKFPANYNELDSRQDRARLTELEAESKTRPLTDSRRGRTKTFAGRL